MGSLKHLKPYLKPHAWLIIGSCLLAIPLSVLRLSPALLVEKVVDELLIRKDASTLYLFPALFVGLYFLNFFVRFAHYYMMRIVVTRVDQKLKNDLFTHLLSLSPDYFTERSTGSLISRVALDPNYVVNGVASINSLIREPVTFLLLLSYALYLDWQLTLITFIIFPPLAYVFSKTGRNLKRYISGIQEENGQLVSTLQEGFTGIRIIKAFRLESYVLRKFQGATTRFADILMKSAVLEEASHPIVEFLTALIIALAVYFGGQRVLGGHMTPGQLTAFFATFAMMMHPLRTLNDLNIKVHQASAAADRIFEVLGWKTRIPEPVNPAPMTSFSKSVSFENISFAYPDAPQRLILESVSFEIPRGEIVAVVGASGSGKSSLVNLLPRIFDVTAGRIAIDGRDIRQMSFQDLRDLIAIVSQDVFLFNDSIAENIRCGRLDATMEEIREASKHAHALEFIEALPNGFDTVIGDRGMKLSGGERQRLSIARAFLRNSPILILDEATSSLDTRSERAVQGALDELMIGKTTLIVAHRLSTIQNAKQILVMKDGHVVERGTHGELVKMSGEYARFHEIPR